MNGFDSHGLTPDQISQSIEDGPLLVEGREIRDFLDAAYQALDKEQCKVVDKTARAYAASPFLWPLLLLFSVPVLQAWRSWRLREVWAAPGTEVARYAAVVTHTQALDPTRGEGLRRLKLAKAAYMHDRGARKPVESRIPTGLPVQRDD